MKSLFFALTLISSLAFAGTAKTTKAQGGKDAFKLIHVADLQKEMKGTVYIFDANNEGTRTKEGVIPGAKLLPSSNQYDAKATLPADKGASLVFYCANTECMASHSAAKRASEAGYTNVKVMADGIQGWKAAGQKTEPAGKGG